MILLRRQEIQEWDAYTIQNEPISSIDLMERASAKCVEYLTRIYGNTSYEIVCGTGNNGGDGLAIARMLHDLGCEVGVVVVGVVNQGSTDFQQNLARLPDVAIRHINELNVSSYQCSGNVLIDALFGTGLTREISGWRTGVVSQMNKHLNIVSIDIPSGLLADEWSPQENVCVTAGHTLTFQIPKMSMLIAENGIRCGTIHILDIGLNHGFTPEQPGAYRWTTACDIGPLLPKRETFSHKGTHGHLLVIAGSEGKMGAAVLATEAALQSGVGLATAHVPRGGLSIMQTAVPSAMCEVDESETHLSTLPNFTGYQALVIGPGLGTHNDTTNTIDKLLSDCNIPMVIDADGLNCIANLKALDRLRDKAVILTPHPKEFDRLFGPHTSEAHRLKTLHKQSADFGITIVLKGAFTRVSTPDGLMHFNSSGNPLLATAGSGDVLAGMIGALLARGLSCADAARAAVLIHGAAADHLAHAQHIPHCMSTKLVDAIPEAFGKVYSAF